MILPSSATDNISYSTETQIFLCEPCRDCHGSGNDQDISSSVNPTKPYQDKGCKKCGGRGWTQRYITFENLVEAIAPALFERFIEKLPEIIAQAKYEVVRSVMES